MIQLKKPPAQINRSLQSGLEFLLRLAISDKPVSLTQIAQEFDMDYTRVNRLFGTLAAMGFAERTSDRRYIAGSGIHILATLGMHKSHLLSVALPHLNDLIARLKVRIALGVMWGRQICYIFYGGPNTELSRAIDIDMLYEAEHSSIGLAMLALMSDEEISQRYAGISDDEYQQLQEKIAFARKHRFAYGGKTALSLAVALGNPAIAGLAAAPEGADFEEQSMVHELQQAATKIYRDLNARG